MTTDPEIKFVKVGDIRLAFRESGDSAKPPMVLLHGFAMTSAFFWRPLISRFKDTYHIIAFDLLGHGDSDAPFHGYDVDHQTKLIAEAMQILHAPAVILVGHSMGGVIATRLAIEYPAQVRQLVLYDALLPDGTLRHLRTLVRNAPLIATLSLSLLLLPGAGIIVNLLPRRPFVKFLLTQLRVVYHRNLLTRELIDQSVRNSGFALAQDLRRVLLRPKIVQSLGHITMPTLFLVGDHDLLLPVSDAEGFSALIAQSELAVIGQAGHYALLDNPEEFNARIVKFLASGRAQ